MRWKKVLLGVLVVFFLVVGGGAYFLMAGQSTMKGLVVGEVDVTSLADGTYTGQFRGWRWANTVEVTVSSGRLSRIEILDDIRLPVPGVAEKLITAVIESQSLKVDAESGATVSTTAYLKAIENALTQDPT